ncbi:MAG: hypothetical protein MUO22_03290, partial [Sedimentisphaerales bacterium]|nr:hypothetical protein [Sedimentisphaerales bacterium]
MDDSNPDIQLNTVFDTTEIMLVEEDPDSGDETSNETGGGIGVIDSVNNLTYIDVELLSKKGGKTE